MGLLLASLLLLQDKGSESKPGISVEEQLLSTVPPEYTLKGDASFGKDGRSVAYIANKGGTQEKPNGPIVGGEDVVIFKNKVGKAYFQIEGSWGLHISPDGAQVAYTANRGNAKCVAVVGDTEFGGEFEDASFPVFSPDGKSVAYWARDGAHQFLVVDHKRVVTASSPLTFQAFAPGGKIFAYVASRLLPLPPDPIRFKEKYKYRLILGDRQVGEEYDGITDFMFSPDGSTFSYTAYDKDGQHQVLGDKKGPAFEQVRRTAFSPDGKHLAYSAFSGGRLSLLLDDKTVSQEFTYADFAAFSPDGSELAYMGEKEGRSFLVAGANRWAMRGCLTWQRPVYSPDGRHVAYVAYTRKGGYVAVGGQETGTEEILDQIYTPPAFSPDGKKVVYGARKGRDFWWKVIDVR